MRSPSRSSFAPSAHRAQAFACTFALLLLAIADASAQQLEAKQAARFTGPLVSAAPPLPQGVLTVEPYLVDTQVVGYYDHRNNRHDIDGKPDGWNLVVPMQYGVTGRLTLGVMPSAGFATTVAADRHLEIGDTDVSASYLLARSTAPHAASLAVALHQNLTTGTHDRLDRHGLAEATGSGAPSTRLALYGQAYFLPERTLRGRFNVSWRVPGSRAPIEGASAYGTAPGFSGHADLRSAMQVSLALEYSLGPNWTLAGELLHERDRGVVVRGTHGDRGRFTRDGTAWWRHSFAPAVEYHWTDNVGLIAGAVVSFDGRDCAAIFSPQVALNMVF